VSLCLGGGQQFYPWGQRVYVLMQLRTEKCHFSKYLEAIKPIKCETCSFDIKLETMRRFFFHCINRANLKWKMKEVASSY
jgi:hypothetical protein